MNMTDDCEKRIEREVVILTQVDRNSPRKASLMIERPSGQVRRISLYDQEGIDVEWVVGEKYELNNVKLMSRSDGGKYLTSSGEASVNRLTYDSFSLLVLGDTHFGYRNRVNNVDTRYTSGYEFDVLESLVKLSKEWNIDGVMHTGDVFDDSIAQKGYNHVENVLRKLDKLGVHVRFVTGNHDQRVKNKISSISSLSNVRRIGNSANWGKLGGFNIIGMKSNDFNDTTDFNWSEFESRYDGPNIVLAHPTNVEQNISEFKLMYENIEKKWILFFGHHHKREKIHGDKLKIIFTGFPAKSDGSGNVWRVCGGRGYCRITRHSLRKWV